MDTKKKRLLVLSAPAGSGHLKAAEALCQVASEKFGMEAFHVNLLNYISPVFSQMMRKGWQFVVKYTPIFYKIIYYNTNKPKKSVRVSPLWINEKKYRKLIEEFKPDIILSTHFFPAKVSSWMYERYPIANGVVITDYESHSMWVYPNNNRVFVASAEMVDELSEVRFNNNKICVSGIPVGRNFLTTYDVEKEREKLGFDPHLPAILVMSGGDAVGPFIEIMRSLSKIDENFQVIVVAGRNEVIRKILEKRFKLLGLKGKVLGFLDNIEEYMEASDLLISKAGGMTSTESLTVGLPMLVVRPTPGQEDGNTEFLVKGNAAIYVKHLRNIKTAVGGLLKDPGKIAEMRKNAKKLSKPEAAEDILKEMLSLIYKAN